MLKQAILEEFNKYQENNINILLNRVTKYDTNGRNQSEDEAKHIDETTEKWLNENTIPFVKVSGNENGFKEIVNLIFEKLKQD